MIKYIRYGFFIIGVFLCGLFVSYYFGYCQGKVIGPGRAYGRTRHRRMRRLHNNKTIAIVNLDEGTQWQGEQGKLRRPVN